MRDAPDPATGVPVIVDFVCAGISSLSFYTYLKAAWNGTPLASIVATPARLDRFLIANNPDLCHADHDAQGYASATVTPESFSVTFNKVKPLNPDGTAPTDALLGRTRLTVPRIQSRYASNVSRHRRGASVEMSAEKSKQADDDQIDCDDVVQQARYHQNKNPGDQRDQWPSS